MDDTLITSGAVYDRALNYAAKYLSKKYGLDHKHFLEVVTAKHKIVAQSFPTVHTRHSRILVFRMALDETIGEYDLGLLPDIEDMYWNYFLNNVQVYPGVKITLERIKQLGIKIAIVSDGDLSLRIRKAQKTGLLQYVDEVVASEEVIFEKPFSAIYTLALSRLKGEPHDAVMLGNDYRHDIRGAQLLGIKAGIFAPKKDANLTGKDETIIPDFVINKFPDIIPILEK